MNKAITKEQEKTLRMMGFKDNKDYLYLEIQELNIDIEIIDAIKHINYDGWEIKCQDDIKVLIKDILEIGYEMGKETIKHKIRETING